MFRQLKEARGEVERGQAKSNVVYVAGEIGALIAKVSAHGPLLGSIEPYHVEWGNGEKEIRLAHGESAVFPLLSATVGSRGRRLAEIVATEDAVVRFHDTAGDRVATTSASDINMVLAGLRIARPPSDMFGARPLLVGHVTVQVWNISTSEPSSAKIWKIALCVGDGRLTYRAVEPKSQS